MGTKKARGHQYRVEQQSDGRWRVIDNNGRPVLVNMTNDEASRAVGTVNQRWNNLQHVELLAEFIQLVEKRDALQHEVCIPVHIAEWLLEIARRSPLPRRGPVEEQYGLLERFEDKQLVAWARERKQQLMAAGHDAYNAGMDAAKEASKKSKRLSDAAIFDALDRTKVHRRR